MLRTPKQVHALLLAAAIPCLPALAGSVGITPKIGTLGLGADVTVKLTDHVNARGGYNAYTHEQQVDMDDARVDGEIRLQTIPILLDWHVYDGGFRLSVGAVLNENEIVLSATPKDDFTFNDNHYTVQSLDGEIDFMKTSGYFGLGYGNAVGRDGRLNFACDFGVMFHGQPSVSATAAAVDPRLQAALNNDLQAEVDDLEDRLSGFLVYPVISIGFSIGI